MDGLDTALLAVGMFGAIVILVLLLLRWLDIF